MPAMAEPISATITGKTRVLGILAHPTDHVKAPPGINAIARKRGCDAVMVPLDVAPADLPAVVAALRLVQSFDGAIVTVPHKQAILSLCDQISPEARAVGAANVLRREPDGRLVAGQLDGIGFLAGLHDQGVGVAGRRVHLSGAGGAASAVAYALAKAGAAVLTLNNRSRHKIEAMADEMRRTFPQVDVRLGDRDPSGHDIVINGTTLGMKPGDALPVDITGLRPGMVAAEMVMEPEITPFLAAARAAGCQIHLGHHMLDQQLQAMADFIGLQA